MGTPAASVRIVRFGAFEVDLKATEIRKHGMRLKISEQPFQILAILLEKPGEIVARDELRNRLWQSDTFVDFDHGLNNAVMRLREVLGDSSDNPRFVETIPRRGYRFIAHVDESFCMPSHGVQHPVADPFPSSLDAPIVPVNSVAPGSVPSNQHGQPLGSRRIAVWIIVSLAAAWLLAIAVIFRGSGITTPGQKPSTSLVVLPLENLSGDKEQDYFADGMTDELIANLAKIRSLRVISRSTAMAYKGTHKPITEIARELRVDAVMEGTVMRG